MPIKRAWALLFTLCCGACCDFAYRCERARTDCEVECEERWGRLYNPDAFAHCAVGCLDQYNTCADDQDEAYDEVTLP